MNQRRCQLYEGKIKFLSHKINTQNRLLNDLKKELHHRIHNIECRLETIKQIQNLKIPTRKRRKNSQIEKRYQCEVPGCEKIYGSVSAVTNHIKLKHQDYEKDFYWKDLHNCVVDHHLEAKNDDERSGEEARQVELSRISQVLEDLYQDNSY